MAVGPSQAPMMPMQTASSFGNPRARARTRARKIPNCPAAPSRKVDGLERTGPKSVMAPIPMKISRGKSSFEMPMS